MILFYAKDKIPFKLLKGVMACLPTSFYLYVLNTEVNPFLYIYESAVLG